MKKIFIICLISVNILIAQTATQPSGTGTSSDPYLISNLNELYWIADQVTNAGEHFSGKYFRQTANIDASATSNWFPYGGGVYYGWLPIGKYTNDLNNYFAGYYDGEGYLISNLYVNRTGTYDTYQGLFGHCRSNGYKKSRCS